MPDPTLVLTINDCEIENIQSLLARYQLKIQILEISDPIPGSFWGESEAGLIGNTVFVRGDTPVHSLLHETCHYVCMDEQRRLTLHTDAKGNSDEENAACYLQILLANHIPEMSSKRMMEDMDNWGYSFRLGSAKAWFENDADDVFKWLLKKYLIDNKKSSTFKLRVS